MNGVDLQGRRYLTFTQAQAGTPITVDGDFDCVRKGIQRVLIRDRRNLKGQQLWFRCDCERHYLDGQADFYGGRFYVGIYPVTP